MIIKTANQIKGIKEASKIAAKSLLFLDSIVKEGVTTDFINDKAAEFIRDHGGVPASLGYKGFPKETCISVNDEVCHGIPSDRVLREGDILNVDVVVEFNGFYGDTSKMYQIGKISDEAQKLIKITKECLYIGIDNVGPCRCFGNIGYNINKHAVSNGLSVVTKFCGHGVGVNMHESLVIPHVAERNSGKSMYKGMVFTIEPMINIGGPEVEIDDKNKWTARTKDGSLSAQYEHTIVVTNNGSEILTLLENE